MHGVNHCCDFGKVHSGTAESAVIFWVTGVGGPYGMRTLAWGL